MWVVTVVGHPGAEEPTSATTRRAEDQAALEPVARTHPFLFVAADEVRRTREKIQRDRDARATFARLAAQGEKDLAIALPTFETDWWREARKKPWRDTYQEIYHHTMSVPAPAMAAARRLAQLALLSDDERFDRRAREILLYYTNYSFEFEHYDVGMNYAIWAVPALDVYDMLFESFSASERQRINAFFGRFLDAVMRNDRFWIANEPGGRFNNHYAFHKQAIAAVGLFFGRDDLVKYAVESREGVRDLLENGILDKGLWLESSFHYHFTPLYGLTPLAEMLRHAGGPVDLYAAEFHDGHCLKQLFDAPFEFVFPDGLAPNIGDGYGHDLYLQDVHLYEYAYAAYGDPRYAWLLSRKWPTKRDEAGLERERTALFHGRPVGDATTPTVRSQVFPEHGYVFLRMPDGTDYWRGEGWSAFLTFDRSGIHGHADKLGLILWGRGRLLAQDVEGRATKGHSFSSAIQREINRRTLCSNTVVVDGRDQANSSQLLRFVDFAATAAAARTMIADTDGILYPGVRQQRTVIVTPDYVLDVFRVQSDEEHTYDWTFHPLDEDGRTSSSLAFSPIPDAQSPAPRWVKNGRRARTDQTWSAEWIERDIPFRLTMLGEPGTEVFLWDFPRDDQFTFPPLPTLQVRRRARSTDFVALYQAGGDGLSRIGLKMQKQDDGSVTLEIALLGKRDRWTISPLEVRQIPNLVTARYLQTFCFLTEGNGLTLLRLAI